MTTSTLLLRGGVVDPLLPLARMEGFEPSQTMVRSHVLCPLSYTRMGETPLMTKPGGMGQFHPEP